MKIGLCASTRWSPGNWQLHWRFIRIVSIDYQSKRRDVCTAAQRRRCNVVVAWRVFRWEGEPQQKLKNDQYVYTPKLLKSVRRITTRATASTSGATPSFLPYGVRLYYTATERTVYAPGSYDEPLISHPTQQPGLTRAVFRLPLHLWLGVCIGDLGWGPRKRHLVLYSSRCSFRVEIILQAEGPQAYTHIGYLNGSKGRTISILRYS
jgi:hypothetical protein